jgi:hypothetical protein
MKEFYEFLNGNEGGNFIGFLVFLIIVFHGIKEIVKAIRGKRVENVEPKTKSKKQQLND